MSESNSTDLCVFDNCGRKARVRDMCQSHYRQTLKGKPLSTLKTATFRSETLVDRFVLKTCKQSNGCILWTASVFQDGYGRAKKGAKTIRAHRLSYELFVGTIQDGLYVLHNCPSGDTPLCVNPAHLWLGTHQDNMDDMVKKGRSNGGNHGRVGGSAGFCKINAEDITIIRARCAAGENKILIGKDYGISDEQVRRIHTRQRWAHIP